MVVISEAEKAFWFKQAKEATAGKYCFFPRAASGQGSK